MKRIEITPEFSDVKVRAAGDGSDHFHIEGHAAVFGLLSENLGGFREKIHPDAFNRVLSSTPDVRLLIDHNPSTVLARTTNGTLDLKPTERGLKMWARVHSGLPEAAGLRTRLETGLVDQMSFAFTVDKENDVRSGEDENGVPIFEVREANKLFDVSTVTYGAYPQTDVGMMRMRMLDDTETINREPDDRLVRLDEDAAAEERAVQEATDREFALRKRKAVRRARLLVPRLRWDGSAGRYSDSQWAKACILDRGTGTPKERYGLPVANPGNSWSSSPDAGGVHAAAGRINQVNAPGSAKKTAYKRLVACYHKIGETPPDSITTGAK